MTKFLVQTKGDIQVVGFGHEMHAHFNRPSVVGQTDFMSAHIGQGQVEIITQLEDDATDAELEKLWLKAGADKEGKALDIGEKGKDADKAEEVAAARRKVVDEFVELYGVEKKAKPAKGTGGAPAAT